MAPAMTLRRYAPLKPSRGTQWPRDVREQIVARDSGHCVCARAGFPLDVIARCPVYPVELDHVRASGALGRKSRSTVDNGVCLSNSCHQWKGLNGRTARPLLLAYLAQVGWVDAAPGEWVEGYGK
jgi:hypothetical protein